MNTLSRFETCNYDDLNRICKKLFLPLLQCLIMAVVKLVFDDSILITN